MIIQDQKVLIKLKRHKERHQKRKLLRFLIEQKLFFTIQNLNTGDILLVGKGHEKTQDIGNKKIYFSDKKIILNEQN